MMTDQCLKFFSDFYLKHLGIVYAENNFFQLEKRILSVLKKFELNEPEALVEIVKNGKNSAITEHLLDVGTNNETSFFRDTTVFNMLRDYWIPKWFETHSELRIWSAASSTGQEAYSMSILLNEFKSKNPTIRYSIVGTDMSQRALEQAKKAQYSELEIQRGMPTSFLLKYCQQTGDGDWKLNRSVTAPVTFHRLNLIETWPNLGVFDLVLCRNVLIYQSVEGKKKIFKKLAQRLSPNGTLILGSSENLVGLSDEFDQHLVQGAIIYDKKNYSDLSVA